MGEVYRARDTRLGRVVALKVLASQLRSDVARRQRFEREARSISSLSHPHICTLFDVGCQDSVDYLVMEYLEGETLAERLKKSPLGLEQVLKYSIELASALDKAHRHGVVHRDLKPGNVMLTKSGAKLLDFGLAKSGKPFVTSGTGESTTATADQAITAEGTIAGTLQYMSPEQLQGKEADVRSDIFALGAVIYEMATGRRAFEGKSQASVIAAILEQYPPPISTLQPMAPAAFDRVIKKCLAKDSDERWQTARDLRDELEWIRDSGLQTGTSEATTGVRKRRQSLALSVVSICLLVSLIAIGFLVARLVRPPVEENAVRFSVPLPEKTVLATDVEQHNLSISPDGRYLAFIAASGGHTMLWVRPFDALSAKPLAGTENAISPFWSPDSRVIGFFADAKLKRIEARGGAVQTLCDVPAGDNSATWGRSGVILFDVNKADFRGLYRVAASGGIPAPALKTPLFPPFWAHFLPDGRHFFHSGEGKQTKEKGVYVASLDSSDSKLVLPEVRSRVEYAPPGYLLYVRESNLLAQPFDAVALRTTGEPLVVVEQLPSFGTGWAEFSVSENGVLAHETKHSSTRLVWFDRTGRELGTVGEADEHYGLRLSPDGKRVGVGIADARSGAGDIWIYDLPRNTRTRFTFHPDQDDNFIWSPDGRQAAFFSWRGQDKPSLYLNKLGDVGDGESSLAPGFQIPTDWSWDGRFIIYRENDPKVGGDLWIWPLFGDRRPYPFQRTPFNETNARFSPDNRWVAFDSDESGSREIYVRRFEGSPEKTRVSTAGGTQPSWRRNGKGLFYLAADSKIMAVSVKTGDTFEAGIPRPLFRIDSVVGIDSVGTSEYDVTADGERFLVNMAVAGARGLPMTVVVNWTAELRPR
jgi:serine/threonine protein kinase